MRQVMVIGLDGATFRVIRPLVEAGRMPYLARLIEEGVHGVLWSTEPPKSPSAWASFMTGNNPGRHGIYNINAIRKADYGLVTTSGRDRDGATLWAMVSQYGGRVCVINVPMTYPPEPVNGYLVAGFDAPQSGQLTHPPELYGEVRAALGDYIIDPPAFATPTHADEREVMRQRQAQIAETIANRLAAARYLWGKGPFDLFVVVFTVLDRCQHFFWKCRDNGHPEHRPEHEAFQGVIDAAYQEADRAVGELLRLVGRETAVVVMSDHGFGPIHRVVYLNNWLAQEGYLRLRRASVLSAGLSRLALDLADRAPGLVSAVRRALPSKVRARLFSQTYFAGVDWPATRAFALGVDGHIYIHTKGEYPQGTVQPGAEYEALCQELTARLMALRDPATGQGAVERVWRREELYHGPHLSQAPDLVVQWKDETYRSSLAFMNRRGRIFEDADVDIPVNMRQSARHTPDGILIASGPGLQRGARLDGARIVDLCPTILHLMGLPVPDDLDGRVLVEALTDQASQRVSESASRVSESSQRVSESASRVSEASQLVSESASRVSESASSEMTAEEIAEVEERLRGLGYIS